MSKTITFSKPFEKNNLDPICDKAFQASHNLTNKLEKEIRNKTSHLNATDEELSKRMIFKCKEDTKTLFLDNKPILTVYPLRINQEEQKDGSIRMTLEQNIKHHK